MEHLEEVHNSSLQTYLEHVITTLGEEGPDFHEKLAELYLQKALDAPDSRCSNRDNLQKREADC